MLKCNIEQDCIYVNQGICNTFKHQEPAQNIGDKIRSMDNAKMAEFLSNNFSYGYGKSAILDWLNQLAEE